MDIEIYSVILFYFYFSKMCIDFFPNLHLAEYFECILIFVNVHNI